MYPAQGSTPPSFKGSQSSTDRTSRWIVTDAAENRSWSYGAFWATAVPLLFASVIVPMVGGSVYRRCVLFWRKGKRLRRGLIKLTLVVIVAIGFVYVFRLLLQERFLLKFTKIIGSP